MIYIFVSKSTQHFFIDYIHSIKHNYEEIITVVNDTQLLQSLNKKDIVIFVQDMHTNLNCLNNVYLLNTEQLSKQEWVNKLCNFKNISIIDYSLENCNILKNKRDRVFYLPYMVNNKEIFNYNKIFDVAVIGDWYSNYRRDITNNLKNNLVDITFVEGFNEERDEKLFRHKILLNVHCNERFKIFEEMRCNRCIFNKMIVITEKSVNTNYELSPYIIECDYDKLVETTINVLENYDYYYNKLFSNFDLDAISENYKKITDKLFSEIH